jgi:hypothetical protein
MVLDDAQDTRAFHVRSDAGRNVRKNIYSWWLSSNQWTLIGKRLQSIRISIPLAFPQELISPLLVTPAIPPMGIRPALSNAVGRQGTRKRIAISRWLSQPG